MIEFAKGHGTGNDFVVIPDADGALELSDAQVAAICDRRYGIGGDGTLRVVRAAKHPSGIEHVSDAEWFMDYRNADGSAAEMCGNGVRVFARYLLEAGLVEGPRFTVATRAGLRAVEVRGDDLCVDMAPARFLGEQRVAMGGREYTGTHVSMGNPHLVVRLASVAELAELDLTGEPDVDAAVFPNRTNVEFLVPVDGGVRMRVYERGVGETLSCGTGASAVGAVALDGGSGTVRVDVPGGRLSVTVDERTLWLCGPAVMVAEGRLRLPS